MASDPRRNAAPRRAGRHFLQIPGPAPVPDRILRAIDAPVIDHRSPEFGRLGLDVLAGMQDIFRTRGKVVIYPGSGTGAWEAALVNTLSPGDRVIMFETGQFASLWKEMAGKLGLELDFVPGDWRHAADPKILEAKLADDKAHKVKAVCVVHNETSTGVTSPIAKLRKAIDAAKHPALFMVDTVSSLASLDYRPDDWGVDVSVSGSQKGLMLPPGISFNAISDKALAVHKTAKLPRAYWDWDGMLELNKTGFFPYTPATNLLYGLREAIAMIQEEGLDNVAARHRRMGEATRAAVRAWGLEILCLDETAYSDTITAILMPNGMDADAFRKVVLDNFDMSLGAGLGKVLKKVFRIGHLGDINDLTLCGAIAGVEMALEIGKVPHKKGGVAAAMAHLAATAGARA